MENKQLYENLAQHLDQGIVGAPQSPALLEILRVLFPPEEAAVALKLGMQDQTLAELTDSYPELGDMLEEILKRMVGQGTVFSSQRPAAERTHARSSCLASA